MTGKEEAKMTTRPLRTRETQDRLQTKLLTRKGREEGYEEKLTPRSATI